MRLGFSARTTSILSSLRPMVTYANKLCLAPMVRSGELPMRLMALKYGADLVWSPEIIDRKIMSCTRIENTELATVDFYAKGKEHQRNGLVFRTKREIERGHLIFQLGSANPDFAVSGALKVIEDVDGIDLNCGCPKPFSTHAGMGAALLSTPDLLTQILTSLVKEVGIPHKKPISAKIRLLDAKDPLPTLQLAEKICLTGVSNLTVHCRTRDMRNKDTPIRDFVNQIHEVTKKHGVSLVINGAFEGKADFKEFQKEIANHEIGGMMAEAAESNPTVFSSNPLPWRYVIPEFIRTCISCDNHPSNTKYILLNQLPGKSRFYQDFCKIKNNQDFLTLAETIGDEGNKVFIRVKQKDKQYEVAGNEPSKPEKRPAPEAPESLEKRPKTIAA